MDLIVVGTQAARDGAAATAGSVTRTAGGGVVIRDAVPYTTHDRVSGLPGYAVGMVYCPRRQDSPRNVCGWYGASTQACPQCNTSTASLVDPPAGTSLYLRKWPTVAVLVPRAEYDAVVALDPATATRTQLATAVDAFKRAGTV